jgi:hypothetical protein
MTNTVKQGALDALDGMQQIVEREMVTKGTYVTSYIVVPELKDSLCGGRKYCALGALWVGAGIAPVTIAEPDSEIGYDLHIRLPGITSNEREDFLATEPALQRAYNTLNQAAVDYVEDNGTDSEEIDRDTWTSELEALFESDYAYVGRDGLLEIIQSARQIIENGA